MTKLYQPDEQLKERSAETVTIGGAKYRPKAKVNKVVRKVMEIGASLDEADILERALDRVLADPEATDEAVTEARNRWRTARLGNVDVIYKQVAELLVEDESGKPAKPDKLQDALDLQDARRLLRSLMPSADEDDAKND